MLREDRPPLPLASANDGRYPRPQLVRPLWTDLSGPWAFAFDDDDRGIREGWHENPRLSDTIVVPFPPESTASQVNDTGFHQALWYHRVLTPEDLIAAGHGRAGGSCSGSAPWTTGPSSG